MEMNRLADSGKEAGCVVSVRHQANLEDQVGYGKDEIECGEIEVGCEGVKESSVNRWWLCCRCWRDQFQRSHAHKALLSQALLLQGPGIAGRP